MAKRNTKRNKCMQCGEHYTSFHFCPTSKVPKIQFVEYTEPQKRSEWTPLSELYGYVSEVSGNGYARQTQSFDEWFASIEKYIEKQYC